MSASNRLRCQMAPREAGFTLLEMMVALAIFALAALSLMKLQSYSLRSAADVRGQAMAQLTLDNLAADLMSDPAPLSAGRDAGTMENGGRIWTWVRQVEQSADPSIMRIDLAVAAADGESGRAALILTRAQVLQ